MDPVQDVLASRFYVGWAEMVTKGSAMVLGCSGGSDSLALLALAHQVNAQPQLQLALHPVYVDHGLRAESTREAHDLQAYVAERFGLALEIVPVVVRATAGMSVEMAARSARHRALETIRQRLNATHIALGHQADDQVETVLMRILTGTGVSGLAGIQAQSGRILHPLLSFSRAELRAYLVRRNLSWIEDPSNQDSKFLRNRLRLEVLPYLRQQVNPNVDRAVLALAEQAREWTNVVGQEAHEFLREHSLSAREMCWPSGFRRLSRPAQALLLQRFGFRHHLRLEAKHIRPVLSGEGSQWPRGWRVRWQPSGELRIDAPDQVEPSTGRPVSEIPLAFGVQPWPGGGRLVVGPPDAAPTGDRFASRIADSNLDALRFRTWQPGDRLHLLGGTKKVQDVFVDHKIPVEQKHRWPLLIDAGGLILSVIGLADSQESQRQPATCLITYDPDGNASRARNRQDS